MSDFVRRPLEGLMGLVQGDIEEAFSKQRKDLDAAGSYTAADASLWADPPPSTLAEAIERLLVAVGGTP